MPHRRTFLHTSAHKNHSIYRHSYPSSKVINMTDGPIFSKILFFVLPLILTNLLQVLYNTADMIVVSFSHQPDAVGAIGTTSSFINLIVNIFMGFATGANVIIARYLGANDEDKVSRATHTSIIMSIAFGIVSAIIGLFVSRPVLSLIGAQGKLLNLATTYTAIYFLGVPFISITNYLIAIFRAKGDTRTPLYILSTSGLINVILNLFFVLIVGLSVEGVALATTIANIISAIWLSAKLSKDDSACRFCFKKMCFDRKIFKEILYIGLPAGIQGSLFSLSNVLIQSSILQVNNLVCPPNSAFQPIVKGNAAMTNLESFTYTAQNTVYQAAITFTSQNVGARKYERIYKIRNYCFLIGTCICLIFALVTTLAHKPLLSLYGIVNGAEGSLEQMAFSTAALRMNYITVLYFIITFMEVGCGIVRGLGKSISSTIISLIGACLFRVVWLWTAFKAVPTLHTIYMSYPISWALTAIVFIIYGNIVLKRMIKANDSDLQSN